MRLTRPRCSLRWLMVAVAAVAVAIGGEQMRRRASYLRTASRHAAEEEVLLGEVERFESWARADRRYAAGFARDGDDERAAKSAGSADLAGLYAEMHRRMASAHAALKHKYRRAAARPWLPAAPDPPPP
jgi:hypothetical protein